MSSELTDILERTAAPPMGVDPHAVLIGGRRRVSRRRAVKGVACLAAALAVALTAPAVAGRGAPHPLEPAASRSATADALVPAAEEMTFDQTGTDGNVRSYQIIVTANQALSRNEARLYLVDPVKARVLIGAVALSHPERGPVDRQSDAHRGLVWGIGPVSGNTRANYTLADGTSFSVPIRRLVGTPWEVSVIDGLTLAQSQQAGSATDDRGVPVLR